MDSQHHGAQGEDVAAWQERIAAEAMKFGAVFPLDMTHLNSTELCLAFNLR